jgi:hypothetical protein
VGRDGVLSREGQVSYRRVSAVREDTHRAGGAVECMDGVWMQPSRHPRMMQAMLELKRVCPNIRLFRSGPRKVLSPYHATGPDLPTHDFSVNSAGDPEGLTQGSSTS